MSAVSTLRLKILAWCEDWLLIDRGFLAAQAVRELTSADFRSALGRSLVVGRVGTDRKQLTEPTGLTHAGR